MALNRWLNRPYDSDAANLPLRQRWVLVFVSLIPVVLAGALYYGLRTWLQDDPPGATAFFAWLGAALTTALAIESVRLIVRPAWRRRRTTKGPERVQAE